MSSATGLSSNRSMLTTGRSHPASSPTPFWSDLANRVQPILPYDLGDRVLQRPDPCPCGNPLPAIRVQGRSADVLSFRLNTASRSRSRRWRSHLITFLGSSCSRSFRPRRRDCAYDCVRRPGGDVDSVWRMVRSGLAHLLALHGLAHVTIERADEPPEQTSGGKYRTVMPLSLASIAASTPQQNGNSPSGTEGGLSREHHPWPQS